VYWAGFYPMHLGLLTVGENLMPIAWWTPVSKDPFRFLLAIDRRNWSLGLLRETREAALHFLPFAERERVVRAGYVSGRRVRKAERLGFALAPAAVLERTRVLAGAPVCYELRVARELDEPAGDHAPFVCDVVHVHRGRKPVAGEPLLFCGFHDVATLGARARVGRGGVTAADGGSGPGPARSPRRRRDPPA
jgi:flavin reductase (DIM6/NTAB) family NADH-FMN oxidoreductase RutF